MQGYWESSYKTLLDISLIFNSLDNNGLWYDDDNQVKLRYCFFSKNPYLCGAIRENCTCKCTRNAEFSLHGKL